MPRVMQRSYSVKSSGRVERTVAERPAVARRAPLLGVGRDRRLPAVGRIDDERGLPEGAAGVVAAEGADRVQRILDALLRLLLARGPLLIGLIQAGHVLRPLHRDSLRVVARPDALQIGIAPRRLRHRVRDGGTVVVGRDDQRGSRCALPRHRRVASDAMAIAATNAKSYESRLPHHVHLYDGRSKRTGPTATPVHAKPANARIIRPASRGRKPPRSIHLR